MWVARLYISTISTNFIVAFASIDIGRRKKLLKKIDSCMWDYWRIHFSQARNKKKNVGKAENFSASPVYEMYMQI